METKTTRLKINRDIIKELTAHRVPAPREQQRFDADDALRLAVAIGEQMCPHFAIDTYNEAAYTNIARWLVNDPAMEAQREDGKQCRGDLNKGIYLQGAVGTGKTLCLEVFSIVAKYLRLPYASWPTYRCDWLSRQYESNPDSLDNYSNIYRGVACFQDLGVEPSEVLYMGNRRNVMRSILEIRGDNPQTVTLITSNIPVAKTGDYYGSRVHSRLLQMCNILTIGGSDRRQTL